MCHWLIVLCVLRVLVLVPLLVQGDILELVGLFVEVVLSVERCPLDGFSSWEVCWL